MALAIAGQLTGLEVGLLRSCVDLDDAIQELPLPKRRFKNAARENTIPEK